MYLHEFEVSGVGHFPIDMLRYDSCFPKRQEDVNELMNCKELRTIKMLTVTKKRATWYTPDRWTSFGWDVKHIVTRKV